VQGAQTHPQQFWSIENLGKIPENLSKIPDNLGQNPEIREKWRPTFFDFKKWRLTWRSYQTKIFMFFLGENL